MPSGAAGERCSTFHGGGVADASPLPSGDRAAPAEPDADAAGFG
jgi:hypothetical protein